MKTYVNVEFYVDGEEIFQFNRIAYVGNDVIEAIDVALEVPKPPQYFHTKIQVWEDGKMIETLRADGIPIDYEWK